MKKYFLCFPLTLFILLFSLGMVSADTGSLVVKARGTGQTTGHIATLNVTNTGSDEQTLDLGPFLIPATGRYQGYVVTGSGSIKVQPGQTAQVPVTGYCADIRRPPVPDGEPMVSYNKWIGPTPVPPLSTINVSTTGPYRPRPAADGDDQARATVPGTEEPLPFTIDVNQNAEQAAPFLLAAATAAEKTYDRLQEDGKITTPFSANPQRERQAVVQQSVWIYAADMQGEEYTREDFGDRMQEQMETNSGSKLEDQPPPVQQNFKQGVDSFWDSFQLVGTEAKILTPEKPAKEPAAAAVPVAVQGCTPDKKIEHSPKEVDVEIADTYGNEEDRQKIRDGVKKAVESDSNAYATTTPPSTSYAIWGNDHIGGISSAYAKTIFLKAGGGDEWVWWTDPMTVEAKGIGTHTLSFAHGPECKAEVAGAALMWMKAKSNALDPLENSIEVFRALDKVKELTIEYLGSKLPPGLDDALESGVDAITDPSSDTYAAASGSATLTVGTESARDSAINRVVYKREGKEDKAIVGGGETIKKIIVSDVQPDSLTSKLDAAAIMEAGASGNGLAKAYLESMYGTILVGICECPTSISYEVLTDMGLFFQSKGVKESVKRALKEMAEATDRINKAIAAGDIELTGEELKEKAEEELQKWAESIGGDRFTQEE